MPKKQVKKPKRRIIAGSLHIRDLDTATNRSRWLDGELKDISATELTRNWAQHLIPVHGTTLNRFLQIVASGSIKSHARLAREGSSVAQEMMQNATDVLDIALGLDENVFFNVGRVHPADVAEVYLCFPNQLSEIQGVLVSLREIVHFDALVSWQAAEWLIRATGNKKLNVAHRNRLAAKGFFANTFAGCDFFEEIFPRFLQREFPEPRHFIGKLLYPGTELEELRLGDEILFRKIWEGPQLMVPDAVSLEEFRPKLLIASRSKKVEEAVAASGLPLEDVYPISSAVPGYQSLFGDRPGSFDRPLGAYSYLNLALAELMVMQNPTVDFGGLPGGFLRSMV